MSDRQDEFRPRYSWKKEQQPGGSSGFVGVEARRPPPARARLEPPLGGTAGQGPWQGRPKPADSQVVRQNKVICAQLLLGGG